MAEIVVATRHTYRPSINRIGDQDGRNFPSSNRGKNQQGAPNFTSSSIVSTGRGEEIKKVMVAARQYALRVMAFVTTA